jgi:ribosome biogenesis GTPase A
MLISRREEERIKTLKDREERHKIKCMLAAQKNKEEMERVRKKEEDLMEKRRQQLAEME